MGRLDLKIVAAAPTSARTQPLARARPWEDGTPFAVAVVCDIRAYRDALAAALAGNPLVSKVHAASTATAARLDGSVDVTLIDLSTPEGLAAARDTAQATRVVAMALPETDAQVVAAAEAGVTAFVPRHGTIEDVVTALIAAMRGETVCSPKMAAALVRRVSTLADPEPGRRVEARLTVREREILQLIDDGCSNKQIAARLSIELPTVKNHVHNILEKLQVSRRSEAAARVRRQRTAV